MGKERKQEGLVTVAQVADYLRLNRFTVYRMVERGKLPGFRVTDQWRFKISEIERWLQKQRVGKKR